MSDQSRFVIVNDADAPARNHVAEWVDGVGYCYMARIEETRLKRFDGMIPKSPTPIEDFGFAVSVGPASAIFQRVGPSVARYRDGLPRNWQDRRFPDVFELYLVSGPFTRKRARAEERVP